MNVNDRATSTFRVTAISQDGVPTQAQDLGSGNFISNSDFNVSCGQTQTVFQFGPSREITVYAPANLQLNDTFSTTFKVTAVNGSGMPTEVQNEADNAHFSVGSGDLDPAPPNQPATIRVRQSTTAVVD